MSIERLEVNSNTSETDLYAALMLSKMLDNEQDEASSPSIKSQKEDTTDDLDTQSVIW